MTAQQVMPFAICSAHDGVLALDAQPRAGRRARRRGLGLAIPRAGAARARSLTGLIVVTVFDPIASVMQAATSSSTTASSRRPAIRSACRDSGLWLRQSDAGGRADGDPWREACGLADLSQRNVMSLFFLDRQSRNSPPASRRKRRGSKTASGKCRTGSESDPGKPPERVHRDADVAPS